MTIPLDRLYEYLATIAEKVYGKGVIIYRFWPHGSKNIDDLSPTQSIEWITQEISPLLWCNDQEPLQFEYYATNLKKINPYMFKFIGKYSLLPINNLNYKKNLLSKNIILHSEKRSRDVEQYKSANELIPVYYWSHGLISRDWFRYAQHANFKKTQPTKKTFLIYNRAWTGTREYRLKFLDLLVSKQLVSSCLSWFNSVDIDTHQSYLDYNFKNSALKPRSALHDFFEPKNVDSHKSADFDIEDYVVTDIEIVLETLFDDERLHLTEKILRSIACGQPFILCATHGSLEYLKQYGFKTYDSVWDETYDSIQDPLLRLESITDLMQWINQLSPTQKNDLLTQAQKIADYNRSWFFSQGFFEKIICELEQNLGAAFDQINNSELNWTYISHTQKILSDLDSVEFLQNNTNRAFPTKDQADQWMGIVNTAKQTSL